MSTSGRDDIEVGEGEATDRRGGRKFRPARGSGSGSGSGTGTLWEALVLWGLLLLAVLRWGRPDGLLAGSNPPENPPDAPMAAAAAAATQGVRR